MKRFLAILAVMAVPWLTGCGTIAPQSTQELVASAQYHATIQSDHSYQESVRILKNEILDYGFECALYPEIRTADCRIVVLQFHTERATLFIEIKEIDATHSIVNVYAFWKSWFDRGITAANKLIKK